jgi:hypothetical protein
VPDRLRIARATAIALRDSERTEGIHTVEELAFRRRFALDPCTRAWVDS